MVLANERGKELPFPHTPSSESSSRAEIRSPADSIIEVAAHGDIVLRIEHETGASKAVHKFRVSSSALKTNSKYFELLIQPGRFGEGAAIETKHKQLSEQYGALPAVPSTELPAVNIKDVGRISAVKALDALLTDFFYILHGKDTQTFPPVANLANLAIVADRFDALDIVKSYVRRKKMIRALDGKTTPKVDAGLSEEKVRQRLLVGILLDYAPWMEKYSARLITKGWVGREATLASALWWDLPSRSEEELLFRRECILETIQSIQTHFLALYTSRERLCRMGYDNTTQCDSFQLGEMMRFFTRTGTVRVQGGLFDISEPQPSYAGDLYALLEMLRQVPEYQIDKHHSHCGIRNRILPLLGLVEEGLQHVGICPECWQEQRAQYAWMEAKPPLLWKRSDLRLKAQGHAERHAAIRAMFLATEKHWD